MFEVDWRGDVAATEDICTPKANTTNKSGSKAERRYDDDKLNAVRNILLIFFRFKSVQMIGFSANTMG